MMESIVTEIAGQTSVSSLQVKQNRSRLLDFLGGFFLRFRLTMVGVTGFQRRFQFFFFSLLQCLIWFWPLDSCYFTDQISGSTILFF